MQTRRQKRLQQLVKLENELAHRERVMDLDYFVRTFVFTFFVLALLSALLVWLIMTYDLSQCLETQQCGIEWLHEFGFVQMLPFDVWY